MIFPTKNPLPEGEETESPQRERLRVFYRRLFPETGTGRHFKMENIMDCSRHWKVDYTTFSGARSFITVRAESSDEAKRITAAMTYTDPDDVHGACCVDPDERAPSPEYGRGRRTMIAPPLTQNAGS